MKRRKAMNARVNPIAWLGICALMTAMAGSASAQWRYDSDKEPNETPANKTITLKAKKAWLTPDVMWDWNWLVDTYAKEKSLVHDPLAKSDTQSGSGTTGIVKQESHAIAGGSTGNAYSSFQVSKAGNIFTGKVRVWGDGTVGDAPAASSGQSQSMLTMGVVNKGAGGTITLDKIKWVTRQAIGEAGSTVKSSVKDPIHFSLFDNTNRLWLFDDDIWNTLCTVDGPGEAWMDGGTFSTGGLGAGSLSIAAGHALMGGTGLISLTWNNGIITSSSDDGIFDGLLPTVGSSSLGALFHIGDAEGVMAFDFDFGDETDAGFAWNLDMGVGGEGQGAIVPAPAGAILLSTLGLWASRRRR
jgi:hypothetical protein